MRRLLEYCLFGIVRLALSLRYKIKVKGLENLKPDQLNRPGGVLFLPNHSAIFVDPAIVNQFIWHQFRPRPLIVEYFYYMPLVNSVMKWMGALPVPNFDTSTNSLKRKRNERIFQNAIKSLKDGDNFLIYPAGRLKSVAREVIGGASGVHRILQEVPQTNVVLVRVDGLWGSSFSRAWTGKSPSFFPTLWHGVKTIFCNLIFFTPRREITVEYAPAPADFPYQGSRIEMNKYLERWYNKNWDPEETGEIGEPFKLVPYSMWTRKLPSVEEYHLHLEEVDTTRVSPEIRKKTLNFLAKLTEKDPDSLTPNLSLASDLGLDSLDASEIIVFLEDQYDVSGLQPTDLTTVGQVIGLAGGIVGQQEETEEESPDLKAWHKDSNRVAPCFCEGKTIPEVILRRCDLNPQQVACADARSGILTYRKLKIRILLLATLFQKLPGQRIGIMLPSSVAANVAILACQMAGKTPVMINWTVGPRHLAAVTKATGLQRIVTAWGFIDRLKNVDLSGIEDLLVMLEDVAREISIKEKLKAVRDSFKKPEAVLRAFGITEMSEHEPAVILFTSGTESLPKGVPLSHRNIIENQRASLPTIQLNAQDILYGTLPPFHSFGFSITGLLPLLTGVKVAYSPDPTETKKLARGIEKWGVTIFCSAPTFLKGVLRAASDEQLKSVRLFVSGAEMAPPELRKRVEGMGEGRELLEGYGITECSPILSFTRPGEPPQGVGRPIPGVEMAILHEESHLPKEQGEIGLVVVRGPNVFGGYLNPNVRDPFVDHANDRWYNTGDLGFLDESGALHLRGRLKRFVKIGGEMVSLTSIEEVLYEAAPQMEWPTGEEGPSLAVSAVERAGERPRIYLFCRFSTTVEQVNGCLKRAGFSNLVKVGSVTVLPEIPVLGTGKINYRALEAEYIQ